MKDKEKYELFANYVKEQGITNDDNNNDQYPSTLQHYRERKVTEIIELGQGDCNVTTAFNSTESFPSQRNTSNIFYGVIFRLTARHDLDIMTIEFDTEAGRRGGLNDTGVPVQVYTRLGGFRSFYDSPEGWELIANTTAVPTPTSRGNIVPVHEFHRITMRNREERSFYINALTPEPVIYAGTSEGDRFGHDYANNEHLQNIVGYALDGQSFNGTVQNNRLFHGFIHYQATVSCEDADDVLETEFTWFVNEYDAPGVLIDLANEYVIAAITNALRDDSRFVRYQNFYGLNFLGAESMGFEHEATCPFSWDGCARVVTTARFQHLPTINVPNAHIDILQLWSNVDTTDQSFQMGYYGPIGIIVDYWITLDGVPERVEMDEVMIRYFEDTTNRFLHDATNGAVTGVQVQRQIMAGVSRNLRQQQQQQSADFISEEQQLYYLLEEEEEERHLQEQVVGQDSSTPQIVVVTANPTTNTTEPPTTATPEVTSTPETTTSTTNATDTNTTDTATDTPSDNATTTTGTVTDFEPPPAPPSDLLQDLQGQMLPFPSTGSFSEIRVTIYGLYRTSVPPSTPDGHRDVDINQVRSILESAFRREEAEYVLALRRGVYEPGRISEPGRFDYFADISGATARVIPESLVLPPTRAPTMPPIESNTTAPTPEPLPEREVHGLPYNVVYYVSIFFIVVGALLCLCFMCIHCKNYMDERNRLGVIERRAQQKVDKLEREKARRDSRNAGGGGGGGDDDHSEFDDEI